jgi:hypothetical protein
VNAFVRLRTRAEQESARAILALFREAPPKPTERSATGLQREVLAEFAEAQRMGSWGRR